MTPSPALLRLPAILAAGAPTRTAPREAWEVRRMAADFLGPRLMPAVPFFDLVRVFPATAHAWNFTPSKPENVGTQPPKNKAPEGGAHRSQRRWFLSIFYIYSTFWGGIKALWRLRMAISAANSHDSIESVNVLHHINPCASPDGYPGTMPQSPVPDS